MGIVPSWQRVLASLTPEAAIVIGSKDLAEAWKRLEGGQALGVQGLSDFSYAEGVIYFGGRILIVASQIVLTFGNEECLVFRSLKEGGYCFVSSTRAPGFEDKELLQLLGVLLDLNLLNFDSTNLIASNLYASLLVAQLERLSDRERYVSDKLVTVKAKLKKMGRLPIKK